jgi:hypothetical protein
VESSPFSEHSSREKERAKSCKKKRKRTNNYCF